MDHDELDVDRELGFEPAVSATGAEDVRADARPRTSQRTPKRRRSLSRRISAALVLFGALAAMGGAYASFMTSSGAAGASTDPAAEGRQLYQVSCITCHGANLQGVQGRGPSLVGVGGASVYFQVSTGRMPAVGQQAYEPRKTAKFNEEETRALAAFVQSQGGGENIPTGDLRNDSQMALGGELFRVNCASCHGTTFKGAPLSAGKYAPSLNKSTDLQMWTAMLSGPESMPVFGNNTLTPDQKRAIVAYVQTIKNSADPGGHGIGRIGPVSEAIVIWVGGVGALMIAILWIGAKTQ